MEVRSNGNAMTLYRDGAHHGSIPMKLLERVIIRGDLKISVGTLTKLTEAKISILLLSGRHSRRVAIVLGNGHNDAAIRLAQSQLVFDENWCSHWARRQVLGKVRGQGRLLEHVLSGRPDCRKPLFGALQGLRGILENLQPSATPERIRGLEGAAAHAYFQGLSSVFAPSLDFHGRNRRPPRDPVNAVLSLGYTLLHFEAVRTAFMAGLDPLLGFYHRPAFGRESLASDLIEPLRPRLDAWIWQNFRSRNLRTEHFSRDGEACLLGKAGREIFFPSFEIFVRPLRRHLRRQCRMLVLYIRQKGEPLLQEADLDEDC